MERPDTAGVKPSISAREHCCRQPTLIQIELIEVTDFQFPTRRWLDAFDLLSDIARIKIQTGNGEVALRFFGLLFDGQDFAVFIEFENSIFTRIVNLRAKNVCAAGAGLLSKGMTKVRPIEEVVSKD